MKRIFTHIHVDLDAVFSIWAIMQLMKGPFEIVFVPADFDGTGMLPGDIAVDIIAGGKGIKGEVDPNGIIHSCFALIIKQYANEEDQLALANLLMYVDLQDSTGSAIKQLASQLPKAAQQVLEAVSLNSVLRSLRFVFWNDDQKIVDHMYPILSGMLESSRSMRRAFVEAKQAKVIKNSVAIVKNAAEEGTNGVLFSHGIKVVVYANGYDIGIVRNMSTSLRMDHVAIKTVIQEAGELDSWHFHESGFMANRGCRKSPAVTASKVSAQKLAETLVSLLS